MEILVSPKDDFYTVGQISELRRSKSNFKKAVAKIKIDTRKFQNCTRQSWDINIMRLAKHVKCCQVDSGTVIVYDYFAWKCMSSDQDRVVSAAIENNL